MLNAAANDALRDRALHLRLDALGAQAMPGSPDDFPGLIASETRMYAQVIGRRQVSRPGRERRAARDTDPHRCPYKSISFAMMLR